MHRTALKEMQRVSGGRAFVQVDSYRTPEQKAICEVWVLTVRFHDYPDGWIETVSRGRLHRRLLLDHHRMKPDTLARTEASQRPSTPRPRANAATTYRRRILDMSQHVRALHIGGAYSCTEIVDCIYNELMRPGPNGGNVARHLPDVEGPRLHDPVRRSWRTSASSAAPTSTPIARPRASSASIPTTAIPASRPRPARSATASRWSSAWRSPSAAAAPTAPSTPC